MKNKNLSNILTRSNRISNWQIIQRAIDTRSGSLHVRDIEGNTLIIGLLSDGTLGLQIMDSTGTVTFDAFTTDVSTLNTKVGSGVSTPTTNAVLRGTGSGASAWATTLAGLTLTAPAIADFSSSTHTHQNNANGGLLNLGLAASATAYSTFTPAPTGFSGSPTVTARYMQIGKIVYMDVDFTGTSNATTTQITLPVSPKSAAYYHTTATDNTVALTSPGLLKLTAASTTADCYSTLASGVWTGSGTKAVRAWGIVYEAN